MKDYILILDFGSQYTHLIKAQLGKLAIDSIIEPGDIKVKEVSQKGNLKGIILSGGANSIYEKQVNFNKNWFEQNVPILGICYGHQLIASQFGGKVKALNPEFGNEELVISQKSVLFNGLPKKSIIWMSHNDSVINLPDNFVSVASTKNSKNVAIESNQGKVFGVQFHPEVSHTVIGIGILKNFTKKICGCKSSLGWSPESFFRDCELNLKETISKDKILVGVSGGVDSMTMLAMLRKIFPKDQIIAAYINTGLMPDQTMQEVVDFCKEFDINLLIKNTSKVFFEKLKAVSDPTQKGMVIGKQFIVEFEKIAKTKNIKYFAQGTIWSDVIESGVTKFSSQIKPHHNVGGLPKKMTLVLVEPFRELFKDQVREMAAFLKLPEDIVSKKVFPGPGFAIRVQGPVTKESVKIVRQCTQIVEDVVYKSKVKDKIWMAFAILINAPSLGVKGDKRVENKHVIVIRIVESKNSMTVNFSQRVFPLLEEISSRIVKETEIGRVVYDITNKPPATIEWQ